MNLKPETAEGNETRIKDRCQWNNTLHGLKRCEDLKNVVKKESEEAG
jgi:hypothetical protein